MSPAGGPGQSSTPQITSFGYDKDWFFGTPGSVASLTGSLDVSGHLVFAGNGWVIPKTNADPYTGIDVRGKIIVIAGKPPELGAGPLGEACVDFFSPQQYAAIRAQYELQPEYPVIIDCRTARSAGRCQDGLLMLASLRFARLFAIDLERRDNCSR